MNASELKIRTVTEADLDRCFEIESVAYAGDEAATREKIHKRILAYPEGFVVLENDYEIVGFINCGAAHQVELSDEEFKELVGHDPLEPRVLLLELLEPLGLVDVHHAELLAPAVEGLLADAVLADHLRDALARLRLAQDADPLLGRVAFAFHFLGPFYKIPDYRSRLTRFPRLNHLLLN